MKTQIKNPVLLLLLFAFVNATAENPIQFYPGISTSNIKKYDSHDYFVNIALKNGNAPITGEIVEIRCTHDYPSGSGFDQDRLLNFYMHIKSDATFEKLDFCKDRNSICVSTNDKGEIPLVMMQKAREIIDFDKEQGKYTFTFKYFYNLRKNLFIQRDINVYVCPGQKDCENDYAK